MTCSSAAWIRPHHAARSRPQHHPDIKDAVSPRSCNRRTKLKPFHFQVIHGVHLESHDQVSMRATDQPIRISVYYDKLVDALINLTLNDLSCVQSAKQRKGYGAG